MSQLSVEIKTEGECPSSFANVGYEYEDNTGIFGGLTSIKPKPSNCSPMVVIKQEPEDRFSIKNIEQPSKSTTQKPITIRTKINDIKYDDITHVIAIQGSIKQELSNSSPVVSDYNLPEQDVEGFLAFKNIEPLGSLGKRSPSPQLTETSKGSRNVDPDSVWEHDRSKNKRLRVKLKRTRNKNLKYKCKLCDKAYKRQSKLKAHEGRHLHKNIFRCHECPKSFTCYNTFIAHAIVHSDDRPFQCSICHKSCKRKKDLISHERTHSVSERVQCHLCDKSFKSEISLYKHATAHYIKNRHSCDMCEKSFRLKRQLRGHLAVHSDDRPFKCSMCDKSFKTRGVLNSHFVSHSENRPFNCDKCDRSFKRKIELNVHIRRAHN